LLAPDFEDHQRLFLGHLTSTTHHPWGVPNDAYEDLMGSKSVLPKLGFRKAIVVHLGTGDRIMLGLGLDDGLFGLFVSESQVGGQ
jgi:hypothetical protein